MVSFSLGKSGQSFELAAPAFEDKGPNALKDYLERFGESVYRITLLVNDLAQARRYLSEHNVAYAELESAQPLLWIDPNYTCGASIMLQQSF